MANTIPRELVNMHRVGVITIFRPVFTTPFATRDGAPAMTMFSLVVCRNYALDGFGLGSSELKALIPLFLQ